MPAVMLLANSNVDSGQRVSILAAASPSADVVNHNNTTDKMLKLVFYDSVATVMRQCDNWHTNGTYYGSIASNAGSVNNLRRSQQPEMPEHR